MAARVGIWMVGIGLSTMVARTVTAQAVQGRIQIPLVSGLAITAAVAHPSGDAEVILMVQSVATDAYRMSFSVEGPSEMGSSKVTRRVLMKDHRDARTM